MKKNVVITVRGLQRQAEDNEPVEVISAGTYLGKENTHYLSYEEADEDGKITKNRIKITPDSIEMTKQGGITTQMIFTKNQKQYSCYATPFGELTLGMTTKQIKDYIEELKTQAKESGKKSLTLISGDIHKDLNLKRSLPMVCNAMRQCMGSADVVVHTTPKGQSSTIEIEYKL